MRSIIFALALIAFAVPSTTLARTGAPDGPCFSDSTNAHCHSSAKQDDGYSPIEIVGVSTLVVAVAVVAWIVLSKDNPNQIGTQLPDTPESVPEIGIAPNGMSLRWTF